MSIIRHLPWILCAAVFLAGCSGTGRITYDSPEEAYQSGVERLEAGDYERAIEYFQAVFNYGRGNEWADDAQLKLAEAYYQSEQYILAASEYTNFLQIYRTDERAPRAMYQRAMSYYQLSPNYKLDPTQTQRAIDYFQLFISRYPDDDRVTDAEERIAELRNKLAHKKFAAGEGYARRDQFEAAAVTFESVFDQYPETDWADNALFEAMRSYAEFAEISVPSRQAERYGLAVDQYERLVQIFPESPVLKEAEALYTEIQSRLEQIASRS